MEKSNQILLEEFIREDIARMYAESHTFNGLMKPQLIKCSYEEKSITTAFPVMEWQKNRAGYMHGGLIASAFDITMGLLSRGLALQKMRLPLCWIQYLSGRFLSATLLSLKPRQIMMAKRLLIFTAKAL